jgi:hypothetical protein
MMNGSGALQAVLVIGIGITLSTIVRAENKYNQYTGQWEDVSPDAVPQMNPITG